MTPEQTLEEFLRDQATAASIIKHQTLARESDLVLTKWPAYRFMSPLAATKLFVAEFAIAYKQALRVHVDIDRSQNSQVGEKIDFSKAGRWVTAAWTARQEADELGMPYPDYLYLCFDFLMRVRRRSLPQLNQLRIRNGSEAFPWKKAFSAYWTADRIDLALVGMNYIPAYSDLGSRRLPASKGFAALILSNAKLYLPYFPHFIGRYVYSRGYLSLQECRDEFGESAVEYAISQLQSDLDRGDFASQRVSVSPSDLLMSCFGLPGISISASLPCVDCPVSKACQRARENIVANVRSHTGAEDPRRQKELEDNRNRVAKHRANKRAAIS